MQQDRQLTTEREYGPTGRFDDEPFDIAVIGAGIVGACCALSLQAEGLRVVLLDRAGPGEGCSKGNAGHLAVEHISPLANASTILQVPRMLLQPNGPLVLRWRYLPVALPWLIRFVSAGCPARVEAATRALASLNARSIASYDALDDRFDLSDLVRKEGTLLTCASERGFASARQDAAHLARHGIRTETLSADELRTFDPALSPRLCGAVYYPDSAHVVNPHRLVTKLVDGFSGLNGSFLVREVKRVDASGGQCKLVTAEGVVRASKVVVATGAWSRPLAEQLGHPMPLDTERGYHYMLLDPSVRPRVPTSSHEQRFVITPLENGVRVAGRVELGGLKLPMNPARATRLLDLARHLIPGLSSTRHEIWMGFRPTLPDSLPVIDRSHRFPHVFFAFGHHHLGLTQAAITGQLIADLVTGRPSAIDMRPFRIDRFSSGR